MSAHTIESVKKRVESILEGSAKFQHDPYPYSHQDLVNELTKHKHDASRGKLGNCYALAYMLAIIDKQTLVHALIKDRSESQFMHAWVEYGSICVDLTFEDVGRYSHKDERPYIVIDSKTYKGVKTLANLASEKGGYGPFDDLSK